MWMEDTQPRLLDITVFNQMSSWDGFRKEARDDTTEGHETSDRMTDLLRNLKVVDTRHFGPVLCGT